RQERVGGKISKKYLGQASWDTKDVIDSAIQIVAVGTIDTSGTDWWSVESHRCSKALRKQQQWRHVRSTRLPALVVVFIKPDIRSHPENVCAGHNTEVVQELWRRDGSKRSWCVDVRETGVVQGIGRTAGRATSVKRQDVGERRIRFALREQEHKAREAGRKFIHDAW